MFSQYTWGDFFIVTGIAAVVYYAFVAWKFYREDIRDFLISRGSGTKAPQVNTGPVEDEEEDRKLYTVVPYDSTPASAGVLTVKDTAQKTKPKKTRKKTEPNESAKQVAEASVPPPAGDVELPAIPVAIVLKPDELFMSLAGVVIPQGEQPIEDVIEAAEGVEKQSDGKVVAKPESGEKSRRLAQLVLNQNNIPPDINELPFTR